MSVIDDLNIIDGYFENERFIMKSISSYAIHGVYKAEGLKSLVRLIHDDEPFSLTIDSKQSLHVPVELNRQLKKELLLIINELDYHKD